MPNATTMNKLPSAMKNLLGVAPLRGAVLYPGEVSLAALEKTAGFFPIRLTVYVRSSDEKASYNLPDVLPHEVQVAPSEETILRDCLLGGPESSDQTCASPRALYDFLLRGDRLSLETSYKVCQRITEEGAGQFLSHVALLEPAGREFFLVSDGLLNPRPDAEARLNVIRNSAAAWRALGAGPPRVALLAAIEQVNPGMPVTLESAEIAGASKDAVPGVAVEGPLSFDVALDAEAAREKGAYGEVAGRANILIGSTVEVSNGIYTVLTILPRARSAGVVVGGSLPLAFPFPSDGVEATVNCICLAGLLALQNAP